MVYGNYPGETGMRLEGYGIRKMLNYLRQKYNNPEVMITENGYNDCGTMKDEHRITYIKEYANNVMKGKSGGGGAGAGAGDGGSWCNWPVGLLKLIGPDAPCSKMCIGLQ